MVWRDLRSLKRAEERIREVPVLVNLAPLFACMCPNQFKMFLAKGGNASYRNMSEIGPKMRSSRKQKTNVFWNYKNRANCDERKFLPPL